MRAAAESSGPERSSRAARSYLLDINGGVVGGRLGMEFSYSRNRHRRETIEQVAADFFAALRQIIAHCQSPEAGDFSLDEFTDFGWSGDELDEVIGEISKT